MQKKSFLFGLVAVVLTASSLFGAIACDDDEETDDATPAATEAGDATEADDATEPAGDATEPAGDATEPADDATAAE